MFQFLELWRGHDVLDQGLRQTGKEDQLGISLKVLERHDHFLLFTSHEYLQKQHNLNESHYPILLSAVVSTIHEST